MEELITLLLHLVQKVPYLSELEHDGEMALLRVVEEKLGVGGVVPPKTGPTNAPLAEAPAALEVPGPVAEPPPADAPPPVTSPEIAGAQPEQTNAFSTQLDAETVAALEKAGWTPPASV